MSHRIVALLAGVGLGAVALAAPGAQAQAPSAAIKAAVADPGRPSADTQRDTLRHPAEVLAFAGVHPGEKVAEFAPGGGYFTRILSKAVGPNGHVYAIAGEKGLKSVTELSATYANVTPVTQTGASFTLPEKVDLAWTTDNYHDFHNSGMDIAAFNKAVYDALKPGGVYLIEDYQTAPGAGTTQTNTLHRIEETATKTEVTAAGFRFDGESKVLANPKDDHTLKIFDPAIRGRADQYVLKFRKPG